MLGRYSSASSHNRAGYNLTTNLQHWSCRPHYFSKYFFFPSCCQHAFDGILWFSTKMSCYSKPSVLPCALISLIAVSLGWRACINAICARCLQIQTLLTVTKKKDFVAWTVTFIFLISACLTWPLSNSWTANIFGALKLCINFAWNKSVSKICCFFFHSLNKSKQTHLAHLRAKEWILNEDGITHY